MKKFFITILVLFLLAIAAAFIIGRHISRRALPDYSTPFVIKNLADSVWVYRDSFAMPHVYARNAADLYRVTGYLVAQDRLWQMDLLRRVTTGRLCEIFGKDLLDADMLMRSLRIPEKSQRIWNETAPEIKEAFEAFSDGINQYINENQKKLPMEFAILGYKPEPWKPQHSFNLVGYMAWDLNGSWVAEIVLHKLKKKLDANRLMELVPMYDSVQSAIYPPRMVANHNNWGPAMIAASDKIAKLGASVFHGSNNWAVNSDKSANGKPILANDMHLGIMAPGVWYQMHQVIEGELNVTGVMLPGAPFIISGHNNAIAWGMTNVMNDDIDFYQEEVNPADSNQYMFNGEWRPMGVRKESIVIKGEAPVSKTFRFTHRGPIISDLKKVKNESISMRWLGNEWSNEIRTVYLLNRARNWDEFRNALTSFVSVSQNVVYADTAGNIGLYCAAGVPRRKGPSWEVLPGSTDEFDWSGMVPFDSLPHYYNPVSGMAVSANNKTAHAGYPYYISFWYDLPFRFNRIKYMLEEKDKHSAATFRAIQTDFLSDNVKFYLPDLLEILKLRSLKGMEKKAQEALLKWNMVMDADQVAPAIYESFFNSFLKKVFADEMGGELFNEFITDKVLVRNAIHRVWTSKKSIFIDDVSTTDVNEEFTEIVFASFSETIKELSSMLGNDIREWNWGKIHKLTVSHPLGSVKVLDKLFKLNKGPYETGGSFHTVEPYSYKYTKPFEATHGASQRHIYTTGNWDESLTVIPTGISGIPSSPYYCDQTKLYLNKEYRRDLFSREAVIKNSKYSIVIKP